MIVGTVGIVALAAATGALVATRDGRGRKVRMPIVLTIVLGVMTVAAKARAIEAAAGGALVRRTARAMGCQPPSRPR